ncbi:MAG: S-layer homology domain-containing protein [Oscillospiraceae bacterium]
MNNRTLRRLIPLMLAAVMLVTAALALENTTPSTGADRAPIAQEQCFETCKNVAYTGRVSAMDPEGGALRYRLSEKPARGSVELAEDGTFVYTPFENKTGKDRFTFVAEDEAGNVSEPAKVEVRIRKPSTKVTYADMSGVPSYNAAIKLAEEGVMVGERIGDSYYFRPDEPVNRSQFMAMAMSALGSEPLAETLTTGFADDEAIPSWCKGYVSAAVQQGIVRGYPGLDGRPTFSPNGLVTKAEAAVLLDRMISTTDVAVTTFYPDTVAAPAWAFQAAVNLESAGVMPASVSGGLELEETLTRGQCAQLLAGAMEVMEARETSSWWKW